MGKYLDYDAINKISFTDAVLIGGEVRIEKIALVRDIEKLLASDVAPVRHGRWELYGENSTGKVFLCSNCKFPHNPNKRDAGLKRVMEEPNFCPMCGARMDGDGHESI